METVFEWVDDDTRQTVYYTKVSELQHDGRGVMTLWWRIDLGHWLYRIETKAETHRFDGTREEAKAVALTIYRMGG